MSEDNHRGLGIGAALRWAYHQAVRPVRAPETKTTPSDTSEGSFLAAIARVGRAADRFNLVSAIVMNPVDAADLRKMDEALRRLAEDATR